MALPGGDVVPGGVGRRLVVAGDAHGQVDLDRIGVLELVDQQVAVALPQGPPHGRAVLGVAQHVAGEDQQVVELELAGPAPLVRGLEGEAPEVDGQPPHGLVADLASQRDGLVADRAEAQLEGGQVVAGPVALLAVGAAARHLAEQRELGVLVAGGVDPAGPGFEPLELGQQLVVVVTAPVALGDDRADLGEQPVERSGPVRDLARRGRGVVAGEVPVLVERQGHEPQAVGADAARRGEQERPFDGRVGEQLVEEAAPPVVERDRRRDLVEDLDPRGQAGLDRVLAEDPLGEAVERPDRGPVEVVERGPAARRPAGVAAVRELGRQRPADPVAQLGRGLLGERDRGDRVEGRRAGRDQLDDPVDEGAGLARAGPRLDEQRGGEVARDAVAGDLVGRGGEGGGHGRPAGSTSVAYGSTWGSVRLRSHWRRSSATPMASGSQ